MENINGKGRASFRRILLCATIGLAVSASVCFAQENQNTSHETATIFAAIIAAVSAIAAVVGAIVARSSARAAMKSAYAAMMSAQRNMVGTLLPPVTGIVNQKIDWAKSVIEAVDTPFGIVMTILLSLTLGVGLNIYSCSGVTPRAD
jgi:FtsH-binding integral membrane protein